MKNLERQFQLNVQTKKLFAGNDKIVLAISGGADSTVLAQLFIKYLKDPAGHLILAHVDHDLRSDSFLEKELIDKQFAKYHVKIFHTKWPKADHPKRGVEAAARDFRYDFYKKIAAQAGAKRIALAHHANDQAETVLLKIIRGADWSTVASMSWSRPLFTDSDIQVIRPLLNVPKSSIYAYARQQGLRWIEDPSNQDPAYTSRNQIRNVVLPALEKINPDAVSNIADFSRQIADLKNDQLIEMLKIWINDQKKNLPISRRQLEEFKQLLDNKEKAHGQIQLADDQILVKNKKEIYLKKKGTF